MPSISSILHYYFFLSFSFNETATTEIYTLSLHDALPICARTLQHAERLVGPGIHGLVLRILVDSDRKSTRLNSSHRCISYAVFCLKKKKKKKKYKINQKSIYIKHT